MSGDGRIGYSSGPVQPWGRGQRWRVADKIGRYAQAGSSRVYLQILDLDDLDHLELISSQVQAQLG